ncbi:MAG: glutaredoxin 3 [Pseudomonadota bacterium]
MANVTMYGSAYCPYCLRARALLDELGSVYNYIPVDGEPLVRQEMTEKSGGHTVPQIFIDDTPIGGCDDLYALHREGKLEEMLGIGQ